MLSNIKQGIGNTLTRFRKAINPIRWLGYVRPDEVTIGSTSDLADKFVDVDFQLTNMQRKFDQVNQERDDLHQQVLELEERIKEFRDGFDD